MLRSLPSGLVLSALAVLSFGAGIAVEPLFERSAQATIPARAAKSQQPAIKAALPTVAPASVPAPPPAAEASATSTETLPTPPVATEAAAQELPQPSEIEGRDAEKNVEFVEMKNLPEQDGQGEPGQDVDMVDEPIEPEDSQATAPATPTDAPDATQN